jgi:IclR family acetate operon transcriptional repressor
MADSATEPKARTGSVQSIERAFSLLELMADAGGTLAL